MNNEKEILRKLLAVANNQQKVIRKLAQAGMSAPATEDPNLAYLKEAAGVAATNAGVRVPFSATVRANPGSQQGDTKIEGTYTVIVNGMSQVDEPTKAKFIDTYKRQIAAQRPELNGRVSVLFS